MTPNGFAACLAETLRWEGGYSDHPKDPGGATMAGIIQRVYDAWRDQMGLPRRHVREIERREIEAIYRQNYWLAVRGDELPPGVDLAVWDFAVNSGPSRAIKALQKALGAKIDGHIGAGTLAAVHAAPREDLIAAVMAERRRFIRQIKHYPTFAKGWERRCTGIEAAALTQCALGLGVTPEPPTISVPLPLPDPDMQSASQGRAPVPERPPQVGVLARVKGWLLVALSFGAVGQEVSDVLPVVDPAQALSLWERFEPLVMRLAASTLGHVALAVCGVGALFLLFARRADSHQTLTGDS